jgi:predicted transglutaminase-like cysteine proteinase
VAKYARLYDLGVADADMELTAMRIRKTGEFHAVLVVRHRRRIYILDNLRRNLQGPKRMTDSEVVYFINRVGWRQ